MLLLLLLLLLLLVVVVVVVVLLLLLWAWFPARLPEAREGVLRLPQHVGVGEVDRHGRRGRVILSQRRLRRAEDVDDHLRGEIEVRCRCDPDAMQMRCRCD